MEHLKTSVMKPSWGEYKHQWWSLRGESINWLHTQIVLCLYTRVALADIYSVSEITLFDNYIIWQGSKLMWDKSTVDYSMTTEPDPNKTTAVNTGNQNMLYLTNL